MGELAGSGDAGGGGGGAIWVQRGGGATKCGMVGADLAGAEASPGREEEALVGRGGAGADRQRGRRWLEGARERYLHPGEGVTKAEWRGRTMSCWERGGPGRWERTLWRVTSSRYPGCGEGEVCEAGMER